MRLKFCLLFFILLFFWGAGPFPLEGGELATKDDLIRQEREIQAIKENIEKMRENLQQRQMNLSEEILSLKNKIEEITGNISKGEYRSNQQGERLNLLEENLLLLRKRESEEFAAINKNLTNLQNALLELKEEIEELFSGQRKLSLSQKDDKGEIEKKVGILLEEVTKENNRIRKRIAKLEKTLYLVGVYHTVKEGETLSIIAEKYKVPMEKIIKANKIEDPAMLSVGQRLFIPKK